MEAKTIKKVIKKVLRKMIDFGIDFGSQNAPKWTPGGWDHYALFALLASKIDPKIINFPDHFFNHLFDGFDFHFGSFSDSFCSF